METENTIGQVKHLDYIDAMRGIAVLGVITVHVSGMCRLHGMLGTVFGGGAYGVQLFYVVSALTLMLSMKKRGQVEQRPVLNYSIRRFFRIAPTFYFFLVIYCISSGIRSAVTGSALLPSPIKIGCIAVFLNGWLADVINFPVYGQWSIAVETTFYVLLPFIFLYATSFRRAIYTWWASVFLSLFSNPLAMYLARFQGISTSSQTANTFALDWIVAQLPVFIGGICLYYILSENIQSWRRILSFVPGILAILVARHFFHTVRLLPVASLGIVAFVAVISRWQLPLIVNKATRFIGKISYSAYLCHPLLLPITRLALRRFQESNAFLLFAAAEVMMLVIVVPAAYCSWRLIELPFQNVGRFAIGRINAQVAIEPLSV